MTIKFKLLGDFPAVSLETLKEAEKDNKKKRGISKERKRSRVRPDGEAITS